MNETNAKNWKQLSLAQRAEHNKTKPQPRNLPPKPANICYLPIPKDTNSQNSLANQLVDWTFANPSLDLDLFPLSLKMSPYKFFKLADTNPYFAEALDIARHMVGTRIKKGWAYRDIDAKYSQEMLPEYNQAYRERINEKINAVFLARSNTQTTGYTIVVDPIPNCPEVPERIPDEPTTRNTSSTIAIPAALIPTSDT